MKHSLLHSIAFVGLLTLPMLQMATGLVPERGLGGVEDPPPAIEWSSEAWHEGRLQTTATQQFEANLGLRGWMIRIENQLREWLFATTKLPVTRGPTGWLFHSEYMPSGDLADDVRQRELILRMHNLRRLQTALEAHGVTVVWVLSPSKNRLYPEHLPANQRAFLRDATLPSHYEFVAPFLAESGLRCIDGPALFRQWKDEGRDFPLFTRGGAHWPAYAAAEVTRVLLDRLRADGVPAKAITVSPGGFSDTPQRMENDLGAMANLFDEERYFDPTPVPKITVREDAGGRPIRVLAEGTSFTWHVLDQLCQEEVAVPLSFLYYLYARHDYVDGKKLPKRKQAWEINADLRDELLGYDVILFEINERMMHSLGHGMIEAALMLLGKAPATKLTDEMRDYMRRHGRR